MNQEHKDFAKAVISLARQHKVGSVVLKFRFSFCVGDASHEEVTVSWAEGRHGDKGTISISATCHETISENIEP